MINKRHKFLFVAITFLIIWIIIWNILPVGSGNWNNKQIQEINSVQDSNDFCFAVMGDNKNGFGTFHKIIKDMNNKKPLFAIDVGDLVFDGEKEKYRLFYNEINKSKVPFLTAIGNHEIREGGRSNYFDIFGDFYYSFNYNNSLFIVLDDVNEGYIDDQQMEFLETELKKDFKHKFVFMHVPSFDPREYILDIPKIIHKDIKLEHSLANKENAQQFMDLMSKYNVATVFSSHIHGYFKEIKNDVPYIITGGAGASMWLPDYKHYFYHYVNVCVNGDNLNYEVIKFHSPDNNFIDRISYATWLYVWYFIVTHRMTIIILIIVLVLILDLVYSLIKQHKKNWIEKLDNFIKHFYHKDS